MAHSFNLPPVLQEIEGFLSHSRKTSDELAKARARLVDLETELAKEKAERRSIQNSTENKTRELRSQLDALKQDERKKAASRQSELDQVRGMLLAAQNEHKSVLKIMQDELERSKLTLRQEQERKGPLQKELGQVKKEFNRLLEALKKERETHSNLRAEHEKRQNEEHAASKELLQARQDYARIAEEMRKLDGKFREREGALRSRLSKVEATAKTESEAKIRGSQLLAKIQGEYDQLLRMYNNERENSKRLKAELANRSQQTGQDEQKFKDALEAADRARQEGSDQLRRVEREIRSRDDEVIRIQEHLIKVKRQLQDTDEARKSAQAIANQLQSELAQANSEIERLRAANPIEALIESKNREIHEISQELSTLPEGHEDRADLTTLLDAAIEQKTSFEKFLSGP